MDISKVQLPNGEILEIKDALLRHQMSVLLGNEDPDERDINNDNNILSEKRI